MQRYFDLIKENIIEFDKLLIDKYYLLKLDEIDAVILIKLNNLLKQGEKSLSLKSIVPFMSITKEECSKKVASLIERGFISLELASVKSKETFSLDETYKKLSIILFDEKKSKESDELKERLKNTIILLEKELQKIISPIEKEIISKWFYEYSYTQEEIDEVIRMALKRKNYGINYMDRELYRKNNKVSVSEEIDVSEIGDLFKKLYGNKR